MSFFTLLAVAAMSIGCAAPALATPAAPPTALPNLDGVYFGAKARVAQLGSVQFAGKRVLFDPHMPNTAAATPAAPAAGKFALGPTHMTIDHPTQGLTTTSWGVVKGELWLNVLRPDSHSGKGAWRGTLHRSSNNTWLHYAGPSTIQWDTRRGRLALAVGSKRFIFKGIRRFEMSLAGSLGVLPIHRGNKGHARVSEVASDLLAYRCTRLETKNVACPFGLFASEPWTGAQADKIVRPYLWRQHGDVILTPWSIRLGPVGMIPDPTIKPRSGVWTGSLGVGAAPPTIHASARFLRGAPPSKTTRFDIVHSRNVAGIPGQVGSSHAYRPNAAGITIGSSGCNCLMGHLDVSGTMTWFPMKDGRIFLFNMVGGHDVMSSAGSYVLRWNATPQPSVVPVFPLCLPPGFQ